MESAKKGYHVVVNDHDSLYVTWHPRTEDSIDCFDESWQSIGFFKTQQEARRFAREISELTGICIA